MNRVVETESLENGVKTEKLEHGGETKKLEAHSFTSGSESEAEYGPLKWTATYSKELQELVDAMNLEEIYQLDFSLTIAAPLEPDCPLVACSAGFTRLTGYTVREIVGRNCRFLLQGVPPDMLDDETRSKCRSFCAAAQEGQEYDGQQGQESLPPNVQKCWTELPKGEMICVQTNARKTGELFRNMFYLKQVELDDQPYILGLQAGLPDDFSEESMSKLEEKCHTGFRFLDESMSSLVELLCAKFWYSGSMRRQDNM